MSSLTNIEINRNEIDKIPSSISLKFGIQYNEKDSFLHILKPEVVTVKVMTIEVEINLTSCTIRTDKCSIMLLPESFGTFVSVF